VSPLFDHVDLRVTDIAKVRELYDALLEALGCTEKSEDDESVCYYRPGETRSAAFFGIVRDPGHRPNGSRLALRGRDRADVDRLAEVARSAGATAFEPPHVCEEYTPFYYATFFEDADGNKLEVCYRAVPE
jgi:catechol 2,3-dioxygenase-like lactoylglutathione lyase family enzyme